ncbi:MAG: YvrJ family protein [Anaerovibrio sp.]|uniref:YvrJ family protein n=1 Tax=Anaerovibrio lipolyticus TaxID=82374 RepID=UPI002A8CAE66|nr:YvrJ family protein [Anaerovibrio lipolyticus]MCI7091800.1 YvrJ family protein [Veillonellaceae bacterium]MDY4485187.1 YvrJ family protein [Anaerovibrio sp.]MCI7235094.1 YvrJ family protein [Veillonellaceae bacterium]MCI7265622.1 YvrJ family protein [Veillonellaceae bacterium]
MDDTLLKAISTTGFPIAVSCYLLVKLQTTLERFSTRLDDLIVELRKGYYTATVQP